MQRGLKVPEQSLQEISISLVSMQRGLKDKDIVILNITMMVSSQCKEDWKRIPSSCATSFTSCLNAKRIESREAHQVEGVAPAVSMQRGLKAVIGFPVLGYVLTSLNAKRIERANLPKPEPPKPPEVSMQRGLKGRKGGGQHRPLVGVSMQRGLKDIDQV